MGGHFGPIHEIQEHDFVGWCTGGCWVTEATFSKQFQLQFLLVDMKLTKYLLLEGSFSQTISTAHGWILLWILFGNWLFTNAWVQ